MEKIVENRTIVQYLPYVTQAITVNGVEQLGNIQVPKRASMQMMHNYFRIGGVAAYLPYGWIDKCLDFSLNWSSSGHILRASEIQWDLREVDHYECYDKFDWEVQWQKEGDSQARYLVRLGKMTESIKIIQQALEGIPGGPYENLEIRCFNRAIDPKWNDFEYRFIGKKPSPTFELAKQELYVRVEAPKGELGIFLIGDQSVFPWRFLPQLVKRMKLADIM
ncbi:hypothetical protein M9H77_19565 [Catharanthus roseus]|uniref:Uncharacterized protein n=1 Tax=Catharanthus roseus TaxID=4058 RepID=A0ACC0BAS7_CATRO|nr:hypothetical protein M9H77_19565 [Catharanthus roseus]